MTLGRLKEAIDEYIEAGCADPEKDVLIQVGKVDMNPVPLKTVSHDDGFVILCDLEEY